MKAAIYFCILLQTLSFCLGNVSPDDNSEKLILVIELARHGARSHFMMNKSARSATIFEKGLKPEELTEKGRLQLLRKGLSRRQKYVKKLGFLKETYDPSEILAFSTYKSRCAHSGDYFIRGLYPMQLYGETISQFDYVKALKTQYKSLRGTNFERILTS